MAAPKKTAAVAAKVEEPKTEVKKAVTPATSQDKTESVKAVEAVKEEVKTTAKKATAKKATVKKETVKKEAVKKEPAKKAPAKRAAAKKAALTSEVHIQFEGKSYSQEDLVKIAQDVWTYDLQQEADKLTSVELYVKPEENMVYYVMNKEITGSFYI